MTRTYKILLGLAVCALILGPSTSFAISYTFTPIDSPQAAFVTVASGINASGLIVGFYIDASGNNHGFLKDGSNYTPLDYPGAISTTAGGINVSGLIVEGLY